MRKSIRIAAYALFAMLYACFLSIGMECMLNLLGWSFAISLDGKSVMVLYPRFIPFCFIIGFLALMIIVFLVILNIRFSEKFNYTKRIWVLQSVCTVAVSIPMVEIWKVMFDYLQKVL